jgi:uncharacterized protein YqiB (DUF1249 family)
MIENIQTKATITYKSVQKKQRYCPDPGQQLAMAAANYHRLQRLLGDIGSLEQSAYQLGGESSTKTELRITVIQRFTYTTTLELRQPEVLGGIQKLALAVRLYHDMQLAEVVQSTGFGQYQGRYTLPEPHGYSVDEKAQLNRLLAEWLQQCLGHGVPISDPQAITPESY